MDGPVVDAAFADLTLLRRCTHRVHRFSPGVEGRALLRDGDRCAGLGHWRLIVDGRVDPSTLSVAALYSACRAGRVDAINSLVSENGIDVNERDDVGWTGLHIAMVHGEEAVVRHLLSVGAELEDLATDDGVHASSLRPELWARLTGVEAGAATEAWSPPGRVGDAVNQLVEMVSGGSVSVDVACRRVCTAVEKVGPAVLQELGTEEHQIGGGWEKDKWTVLGAAAATGSRTLCTVCLELGAAVDKASSIGGTPLHVACGSGSVECARLLLDRGAPVNSATGGDVTPLHEACWNGNVECARLLLDRGAQVDAASNVGLVPLHWASQNGNVECARLLLDRGAHVDKADANGQTALLKVCRGGTVESLRLLLDHGAQVDQAAGGRQVPLHRACWSGNVEFVRLLLDYGAEVDKAARGGATPLHKACQKGNVECARLVLDQGAQLEKADDNGLTPLHMACRYDQRHVAAVLLERGGDPTKRANDGKTPADEARSDGGAFGRPDPEMTDAMELATRDRAAAIQRLRGMDARGPSC